MNGNSQNGILILIAILVFGYVEPAYQIFTSWLQDKTTTSNEKYWIIVKIIIASCLFYNLNNYAKRRSGISWEKVSQDDIVLITGGSNGLGSELVVELAKVNIDQIIILDKVKPKLSIDKVKYIECDLSNEDDTKSVVQNLIHELNSQGKHISILINNAGIRHNQSLLNLDDVNIRKIFNVNTFSPILILRTVIKNHIAYNEDKRLYIVSISSILGVLAPKNLSIYSASKAAIYSIHESLSEELIEYPEIRLLLVTPGQLSTEMFQDVAPSMTWLAPIVSPNWLAKKIISKINMGEIGVLSEPFYANFLPAVRATPFIVQRLCRYFSGMDTKIIDQ
ncbi:hypothetical protein DFJ63DRAFT_282400 [Scheffersomyces coipomensis]|uniref:uncharacterized protein n=1 Tax=Scheffersomyces coipomensis TaxID=1788519 RepID=UPI00315D5FF1